MKKLIILAAIIFGVGISISPALAYTPNSGDLVKTTASAAIYYIDSNGYRHLFPTQTTFFSWYTGTWADQKIVKISEAEFLTLPSGKNVTVKPGYSLIRFDNSLKMYAVLPSGKLCRAPAHYGNYQYKRALVVPSGFETDYYNDGICDITESQKLPDGTLLRYSGSGDIYYIQNNQKRKVLENGFSENNFYRDSIIENISWGMSYTDGASIYGRENSIYSVGNNFGNNYSCRENWTCYNWGSCTNGNQYRTCFDNNYCGTNIYRPIEKQSCSTCTENWSCNSWSSCAYNKQYRTCWDNNGCGTTYSKPIETQSCYTCNENWSCNSWSSCTGTGTTGWQYRSCSDSNRCGTYLKQPIVSQTCKLCSELWSCTAWSICSNGLQRRSCLDTKQCGTANNKPTETQTCK